MTTTAKTPIEIVDNVSSDTPVFTSHGDFSGYDWLDGILGDQLCSEWLAATSGQTREESSEELAGWLSSMIGEGFYLTESDCREAIRQSDSRNILTVREFTPREAVVEIHRLAEAGE